MSPEHLVHEPGMCINIHMLCANGARANENLLVAKDETVHKPSLNTF